MFAQDNICIQNIQGELIYKIWQRNYNEIAELFWDDASFEAPDDGISCSGVSEINRYFTETFPANKGLYFFSHTPAIRIEDGGKKAKGTWYASTAEYQKTDGSSQLIQGSARFDADLSKKDGVWKYDKLTFYYLMTLEPQTYDNGSEAEHGITERNFRYPDDPAPADYVEIAQILGRWCQNRRDKGAAVFADNENAFLYLQDLMAAPAKGIESIKKALDSLKKKEKELLPYPLTIGTISSPLIKVDEDSKKAQAHWIMLNLDTKIDQSKEKRILPCIGELFVSFVKETGWKVETFEFDKILALPLTKYDAKAFEGTIMASENAWLDGPEETGNRSEEAIEDILKLEEYITFWVSGLRYRSEAPFYYNRLATERPEILSYRVRNKEAIGIEAFRKELFGMTSKFCTLQPKAPGNHIGTTPVIEIHQDGITAEAEWLDYGWTTVAEVFGITEPPYKARMALGRYYMRFIKIDRTWKLYGFHWQPIVIMEMQNFDYATTKGWSGTTSCRRFPLPWDEYIYENDPAKKGMKIVLEDPVIICPYETKWEGETDKL